VAVEDFGKAKFGWSWLCQKAQENQRQGCPKKRAGDFETLHIDWLWSRHIQACASSVKKLKQASRRVSQQIKVDFVKNSDRKDAVT